MSCTRRDFLKMSAAGATLSTVSTAVNATPPDAPPGEISVWTTAGTARTGFEERRCPR